MTAHVRTLNESHPSLHHCLGGFVVRMSLASNYQLNRPIRIGEDADKTLRIMKELVGPLVRSEPACKAKRQCIRVKYGLRDRGVLTARGQFGGKAITYVAYQLKAVGCAKLPQLGVGDATYIASDGFHCAPPSLVTAGFRPQRIGCC